MDTPRQVPDSHYQRLGGEAAVRRLVDAFYRAMDTRADAAAIRAMHDADLTHTKRVLVMYFSEWTGGPALYSPVRGAPRLRGRHQPFPIDSAARDAWMACMRQALAELGTPAALRAELDAAMLKVADFMRNVGDTAPLTPRPETTP